MRNVIAVLILAMGHTMAVAAGVSDALVEARLRKASEILSHVEIVTTNAVGYSGACPEANWALSVIAAHDPIPIERLVEIADQSNLEGALMCIAGIKAIDSVAYDARLSGWSEDLAEITDEVDLQVGCLNTRMSAKDALRAISEWGPGVVLRTKIPLLEQTVRPRRRNVEDPLKNAIRVEIKDGEPGATDNPADAQPVREDH